MNAFTNFAQQQGYQTGMPNYQTMGYAPQQGQVATPQMTNPLTDEQRKLLRISEDAFDLKIKPEELAAAICTHKDPATGTFSTIKNPDGTLTCKICHETFDPNQVSATYVEEAVDRIINTLQTCKLIGLDLNDEVIKQFFAIIPYLKRVPKLYKLVNKIFDKYQQGNPTMMNNQGQNIIGQFNMLTNPSVPLTGMQPNYGYNPYYQQQPANPYMGYPQYVNTPMSNMQHSMVGGNPFYQQPGYQAPPQGQQPQQAAPAQQGQPQQQNQNGQDGSTVTMTKPVQL